MSMAGKRGTMWGDLGSPRGFRRRLRTNCTETERCDVRSGALFSVDRWWIVDDVASELLMASRQEQAGRQAPWTFARASHSNQSIRRQPVRKAGEASRIYRISLALPRC